MADVYDRDMVLFGKRENETVKSFGMVQFAGQIEFPGHEK